MEDERKGMLAAEDPREGEPETPPPVGSKGCRVTGWLYLMLLLLILAIISALAGGNIACFGTTSLLLGSLGVGMILFAEGPKEGDPSNPPPIGNFFFGLSVLFLILAALLHCLETAISGLTPLGVYMISIVFSMATWAVRSGASLEIKR